MTYSIRKKRGPKPKSSKPMRVTIIIERDGNIETISGVASDVYFETSNELFMADPIADRFVYGNRSADVTVTFVQDEPKPSKLKRVVANEEDIEGDYDYYD
jgi:hypothetical protein